MLQYKYFYTKRTAAKIRSFYTNVAKKYRHTYSCMRTTNYSESSLKEEL